MSGHYLCGRPELESEDAAIEPRSSFDFDVEVANLSHNMAAFYDFSGEVFDFNFPDGGSEEDEELEHEFFHGRASPLAWSHPFAQNLQMSGVNPTSSPQQDQIEQIFGFQDRSKMPEQRSPQSETIKSRSSHAKQPVGEIKSPDENKQDCFEAQPSKQPQTRQPSGWESGKLLNEQRERNAANTRHSRSANANKKGDQNNSNSDGGGSQKQGKVVALQREKNRVAAAKCRAKKKSANDEQEELATQYGTMKKLLAIEIRDLKNQKTEMQNILLAHMPGVCDCRSVHEYNSGQAQKLVFNTRHQLDESTSSTSSSPFRESALLTKAPGSEPSSICMSFGSNRVSPAETMAMPSDICSLAGHK